MSGTVRIKNDANMDSSYFEDSTNGQWWKLSGYSFDSFLLRTPLATQSIHMGWTQQEAHVVKCRWPTTISFSITNIALRN
jgi:hypothetical protein